MNHGLIQLLDMMATGPIACILVLAAALTVFVVAALCRRSLSLTNLAMTACDDLEKHTGLSFLRGFASFALLFLLKFTVIVHFFLIQFAGIVVMLIGAALLSVGFVISFTIIGKRLLTGSTLSLPRSQAAWGVVIAMGVSLLPIAGWLVAIAAALSGMGALINVSLQRYRNKNEAAASLPFK